MREVSTFRRMTSLLLLFLYCALIFKGSSAPAPSAITRLRIPDWILHGIEYGILGALLSRAIYLHSSKTGWVALVIVPGLLALLYGVSDEVHQMFVPERDSSLHDLAADLVGGLLGGLAWRTLLLCLHRRAARIASTTAVLLLVAVTARAAPPTPAVADSAVADSAVADSAVEDSAVEEAAVEDSAVEVSAVEDSAVEEAAGTIRIRDLRAHARFLSGDELHGRDSPSPDLLVAARYLAERFRAMGLEPGIGGSFFQEVPMFFRRDRGESFVRILDGADAREFSGEDLGLPRITPDGLGAGPLVFAGYGISAPSLGRDDYANLTVRGKVVLVLDGYPGYGDPRSPFLRTRDRGVIRQRTLAGKAENAARHGAVALLVARGPRTGTVDRARLADGSFLEGEAEKVPDGWRLKIPRGGRRRVTARDVLGILLEDGCRLLPFAGRGADDLLLRTAFEVRKFGLEEVLWVKEDVVPLPRQELDGTRLGDGRKPGGSLPIAAVSEEVVRALLAGTSRMVPDIQERLETVPFSFELPNRRVVLRVRTGVEKRRTVNVVARLRGRERPEQAVVLTAHYDHVGENGAGEIFNGADDNASGTATLLEIAEAFARGRERPRRSVWFAAFSGEERGLVGSRRFVAEPPMPLDDIVANLNLDMVGRGPADEVNVFIGPLGTDLERVFPAAAEAARIRPGYVVARQDGDVVPPRTGREKLNLKIPRTRSNFFGRSDQASFYRKGIPAVFFFGNTHADYHRPTDTFEKLNLERMRRIGRFAFLVAWRVAEDGLTEDPRKGSAADAEPEGAGGEPGR